MNLFVEDGLKNLVSINLDGLVHGQYYYKNKNTEMDIKRDFTYGHGYVQPNPSLLGDSSTLYRSPPIIWTLHLLII